jgi:CDP-diacylglycerol--serine O-phosphatidyltransferase
VNEPAVGEPTLDEPAPDERKTTRRARLRRGAYILPSLFTIGNIFFGFFAVVSALNGSFQRAAVLIFLAGILDGLDGRIARLTGTESDFGREFDSLADVITFGMSPALLVYSGLSRDFGRLAWLVPLVYLVCTASRLARFNVQTHGRKSRYFVGLPTPAAACSVGAIILFAHNRGYDDLLGTPLLAAVLLLGILMVSTFRYPSFKSFDLRRRWSYRMALPVAASLVVIGYDPPVFFLAVGLLYTSWAPLAWLLERTGLRRGTDSQHTEGAAR